MILKPCKMKKKILEIILMTLVNVFFIAWVVLVLLISYQIIKNML